MSGWLAIFFQSSANGAREKIIHNCKIYKYKSYRYKKVAKLNMDGLLRF